MRNAEAQAMTQYVSNVPLRARKTGLWTPWGAQRMPDPERRAEAEAGQSLPAWTQAEATLPLTEPEAKPAA